MNNAATIHCGGAMISSETLSINVFASLNFRDVSVMCLKIISLFGESFVFCLSVVLLFSSASLCLFLALPPGHCILLLFLMRKFLYFFCLYNFLAVIVVYNLRSPFLSGCTVF